MNVCKVATATTRNANLLTNTLGVFEHDNLSTALSGFDGTEQSSCPSADYDHVYVIHDHKTIHETHELHEITRRYKKKRRARNSPPEYYLSNLPFNSSRSRRA